MLRARRSSSQWGFTLIELMVVIAIVAVFLLLSVPSLGTWVADASIRNTSESLMGALRVAQSTAVTRGKTTMLVRTAAAPAWNAPASSAGSNWYVRALPLADSDEKASAGDLVQATSLGTQNGVSIAGPSVLCFGAQGHLVSRTKDETGVDAACDVANPAEFDVTRGAGRALRLRVYLGGRVRMCDPAKELSDKDPDGC
jgi:type IV fimbrial biogenesis protein FimT